MAHVRKSMQWIVALLFLVVSMQVLAQTVIHTTTNYPANVPGAVDVAATEVLREWEKNGGTLSAFKQYTIIWNNAVSETYNVSYSRGGWIAGTVPGTRRDLSRNVTNGPLISNCGSGGTTTLTHYVTTIWYVVSTGEIVDMVSRMVTLTLDSPNLNGNC